jgi:hypothetical protein
MHLHASTLSLSILIFAMKDTAHGLEPAAFSGISKPWSQQVPAAVADDAMTEGGSRLLGGLSFGLITSCTYDSNVNQANDRQIKAEGDWFLSLAPTATWETQIRDFTLQLNAGLNYEQYGSLDDYSGLDYRGGAKLGYQGGPLSLDGSLNFGSTQGNDRYTGGLTEERTLGLQFSGRYALSSKTSLEASLSTSDSNSARQTGNAPDSDTSQTSFQVAALWQATPLIELGPGIRSTWSTTENAGDRSTVGPMLRLGYRLSGKVDLDSRIGLDFSEIDGGASDESVSAAVGLQYRLDALWNFRFDLSRDVVPETGIGGGFRESTQWRLGVARKILAAQLDLGVGYEVSTSSGGVGASDLDYLTFDAGLGMPLFGNRGSGRIFLRHQDNSSSDANRDWSGIQSGLSLSYRF